MYELRYKKTLFVMVAGIKMMTSLLPPIPTFLIINKGEVVHQIVGSQPYEKFKQTVLSKI